MTRSPHPPFDSVEDAIADIAAGKPVIVTDDEARENEGDLIVAASKATPEVINMMIRYGSGIICVPMLAHQLKRLGINQMVIDNREAQRTDFTVSVDAADGITTGISAYDRTVTIRLLADENTTPEMLVQPGHVFPLRARPGGVLQRAGHTEAAVDLATLAGLHPSGVICELLNDDGSCARVPELTAFKEKFGLRMISIADLIEYRHKRDKLVMVEGREPFVSEWGEFVMWRFRSVIDNRCHLAFVMGDPADGPMLVRVQGAHLLNDVFRAKSPSANSLHSAFEIIAREGRGTVVYLDRPGGGLISPATGTKPDQMDFRDYGIGAQILSAIGIRSIRLLTSHPRKVIALDGYGLEIVEQIALP